MAWFDDRTPRHPKIQTLSAVSFQWWFAIVCYASEYGTGGRAAPALLALRVPSATRSALVAAGLLDEDVDGLWIHDWQEYNGKREDAVEERRTQARERQRRHRAKARGEVTRDESVTVTDVTRDVSRDVTRDQMRDRSSQARARDARDDQDHDQEEDQEQAGNATSEVDVAALPAGSEHAEEDPEPSLGETDPDVKLGAISGTVAAELGRLRPTEATT